MVLNLDCFKAGKINILLTIRIIFIIKICKFQLMLNAIGCQNFWAERDMEFPEFNDFISRCKYWVLDLFKARQTRTQSLKLSGKSSFLFSHGDINYKHIKLS